MEIWLARTYCSLWLAKGPILKDPKSSGRARVGHKPNLDQPVDSFAPASPHYLYPMNKVETLSYH